MAGTKDAPQLISMSSPVPDSLDQDLRSTTATVTRTLSDYESTLQSQVERIRALEAELEGLSSANASLEEARCDLEFKLSRTVAAKDALATRVDDLTESVEGGFPAWSLHVQYSFSWYMYIY